MWFVILLTGCGVPLLVMAAVCLWRDYQWDKYNENTVTGVNV